MIGMNRHTGKPLSGLDHLRQSIDDIIGTPLGTRLGRREYGSNVPELLDQPMNRLTQIQLCAATALALSRQEPRLRLTRIGFDPTATPGVYELTIEGVAKDPGGRRAPIRFTRPVRALSALSS